MRKAVKLDFNIEGEIETIKELSILLKYKKLEKIYKKLLE